MIRSIQNVRLYPQFISIFPMHREKVLASKHGNESKHTKGRSLYFPKFLQATTATIRGSKPQLSPFKFLPNARLSVKSEPLQ